MNQNRIILFGGSFDPIHCGHIEVARYAKDYLSADTLVFIPAAQSPHKKHQTIASGYHRLEMIRLAIAGHSDFEVSDVELNRPLPSYSYDTVNFFRSRLGSAAVLYWLIGADAIQDLPRWYRLHDLLGICRLAVMLRAGYPEPCFENLNTYLSKQEISTLKDNVIHTPLLDISSTKIRQEWKKQDIPSAVMGYICANQLYGQSAASILKDKKVD